MNLFFDFPLLSTFVALLAIVAIVRLARMGRSRQCSNCGMSLPLSAVYCRRCGRKLDQ